jgi:hypothetical protein
LGRGRIAPATREQLRSWLSEVEKARLVFSVGVSTTGWRFVAEEVEAGSQITYGAEPALEPLGRGLADAAERSDGVRPDENVKTAQGTTSSLVPPDQ